MARLAGHAPNVARPLPNVAASQEHSMSATADECANELLEVVPQIMHLIRNEMRSHRTPDLSVPQFRVLAFINRNPGASLSAAAEHIGLTLPSLSNMMDGLVQRKLVNRQGSQADRRRVRLTLTARGRKVLATARTAAQAQLAGRLATLSEAEREQVIGAAQTLRRHLDPQAGNA